MYIGEKNKNYYKKLFHSRQLVVGNRILLLYS